MSTNILTFGVSASGTKSLNVGLSADKLSCKTGDTITLTVNASNFQNIVNGIYGFTMNLSYDSTKFDYVINSETLLQLVRTGSLSVSTQSNNITVVFYDNALNYMVAGNLLSLSFRVKNDTPAANYNFTLGTYDSNTTDFSDYNENTSINVTYPAPLVATVTPNANILFSADKQGFVAGEKISASVVIPKSTSATDAVKICSFTIEYDDSIFYTPIIKNQVHSQATVNTAYTLNNKKYVYYSFESTTPINSATDAIILNVEFSSKADTKISNSSFKFNIINYKYGSEVSQNIALNTPAPLSFSIDILHIKGDVDGDSLIEVKDLVAIKKHLLKSNNCILTGAPKIAADYDNSGNISISDMIAIKKIILGLISK